MTTAARERTTRTLAVLGFSALAFALGQTTLIPAVGELMLRLHTDPSGVAWTLTGYLVSAAVCTPILGRLGDMFGKRRMLVIALVVFAAGCMASAVSTTLATVVAGRVLQGAGGGVFPLCFGIVRDEFPRERVRGAIGLVAAIAGVGGGLGFLIGGLIVDNASYHWIFWTGAGMGVLAAAAVAALVPESPVRRPGRVDLRGAAVLGVGLVLPLVAVSQANSWGWLSASTLGLIAAGLAILAGFVALQRRTGEPLADVALLVRRPVLMTNAATLLVGFGMFDSFILLPQLAEAPLATGYGLGLGATRVGALLLPASLVMLVVGPLSGILGNRFGSRLPLAIGGLLASLGLALLAWRHGSQLELGGFNAIVFAGIGLAFAAMPNLIIDAVDPAQTGEATGFNALVRSVGSSLGSQVTAATLAGGGVVLAGSGAAARAFPADAGFTTAFLIGSAVGLCAAGLAIVIPRPPGRG